MNISIEEDEEYTESKAVATFDDYKFFRYKEVQSKRIEGGLSAVES